MSRVPVSVESVVQTLSAMEWFFQDGKRWGRGALHNPLDGTKCLVGAVRSVHASSGNTSWVPHNEIAAATYYIERAVRERGGRGWGNGGMVIETFNDTRPSFHEIAAVIARAKEMATADARPLPAPPRVAEILPPPPRLALAYQPEEPVVVKLNMGDLARVALPLRR
jgi:hypothetical protein